MEEKITFTESHLKTIASWEFDVYITEHKSKQRVD